MSLVLCGLPASGKTTIGKRLADQLNHSFIDTDSLIEQLYFKRTAQHLSCREIALKEGHLAFRNLEKQVVLQLASNGKHVISMGGGALCDLETREIITHLGCIIYLKVPLHVVWTRLKNRKMPIFLDPLSPLKSFQKMVKERLPIYEENAHIVIDAKGLTEETLVELILRKVNHGC